MVKRQVDYLIVGQGIGGSVLAFMLDKLGFKVLTIDNSHYRSASMVSAGIINPVTGRRFAYSWRYKEVMETAVEVYEELEQFFGLEFLKSKTIYRYVPTIEAKNDVEVKFSDPYYKDLIRPIDNSDNLKDQKSEDFIAINGYMLDVRALISEVGKWLQSKNRLIKEEFDYGELGLVSEETITYKGIESKSIIFCQGIGILENPYYVGIPILPYKGQLMIGDIQRENMSYILKKKFFLAQLPSGEYWFGSSDNMECMDFKITTEAEEYLHKGLEDQYGLKFENFNMKVGVRPTSYDRRPIIGSHKTYSAVKVLNGLGTKGSSLAPYCCQKLINIMHNQEPLDEALDVNRYDYSSAL